MVFLIFFIKLNNMNKLDILKNIRIIVEESIGKSIKDFNEETSIESIPKWDSVSNAIIMNEIENHFSVEFDIMELIEITSIGDIVRLIISKQQNNES